MCRDMEEIYSEGMEKGIESGRLLGLEEGEYLGTADCRNSQNNNRSSPKLDSRKHNACRVMPKIYSNILPSKVHQ